jgi:hypothetical protein
VLLEPVRAVNYPVPVKNPLQRAACLSATFFALKLDESAAETGHRVVITRVGLYVLILHLFLKAGFSPFRLLDVPRVCCRFFVLNNGFVLQLNRILLRILFRSIYENLPGNFDADNRSKNCAFVPYVWVQLTKFFKFASFCKVSNILDSQDARRLCDLERLTELAAESWTLRGGVFQGMVLVRQTPSDASQGASGGERCEASSKPHLLHSTLVWLWSSKFDLAAIYV